MARAGRVEREVNFEPWLLDPPLPQVAATVGYVAAAGPALATPQLAASDALDSATLGFLSARALQDARREKVKRKAESEKQAERDWQLGLQRLVKLRLKALEEEEKDGEHAPQPPPRRILRKIRGGRGGRSVFLGVLLPCLRAVWSDSGYMSRSSVSTRSFFSGDFVRCLGVA